VDFAPLATGLIKTDKISFSEMLRKEHICDKVAPQLNKRDDVIEWKFMKIAPPRNEELVAPLRNGVEKWRSWREIAELPF